MKSTTDHWVKELGRKLGLRRLSPENIVVAPPHVESLWVLWRVLNVRES